MVFCFYELYPSPIFLLLDFFLMRYKHSLYVREICFCLFLLFAISLNFLLVFFTPVLGGYGFCVWESIFRVVLGVGSVWRSAWVGVVWVQRGV